MIETLKKSKNETLYIFSPIIMLLY